VAAKGVEDTAFYTYLRFAALNEVGGSPDRFGTTVAELHAQNAARRESWPHAMTAIATHDTKRGADVRARLAVLSEMPGEWEAWSREWLALSEPYVRARGEEPAPSLGDRWLFFQTALGAYPLEGGADDAYVARLGAYMWKAAREAKRRTSWLAPDEGYEEALHTFVGATLKDERFARTLAERAARIAPYGASNGLGLVTLQAASPGVADTYQGGELWDLSLVDPDNRAPVDYARRRALLRRTRDVRPRELLASFTDGRVKLHVLRAALRLRRALADVFLEGDYTPIDAGEAIVAFARRHAAGRVVCAVTRLPFGVTRGRTPWAVGDVWGDRIVPVPRGRWRDAFTGREHEVAGAGLEASRLFDELPVALLVLRSPIA
jgi:(1->4)-alpha-D-glucan 1-alpha-D-glucosylmutase